MFDFTILFLLGILAGCVVGILPSLSPSQFVILAYLWLGQYDPIEIIVFYITFITVSNFIDCLPSVYFGIPGEYSAVPTANESSNLIRFNLVNSSIHLSAVGRMVGSLFALILSFFVIDWILGQTWMFRSTSQLVMYITCVFGILLISKNKLIENLVLMSLGFALGSIGYSYALESNIGTFGAPELHNGLPAISVLMGIYVLPTMWHSIRAINDTSAKFDDKVVSVTPYWGSMFRGSVIGWLIGFVPGMSYVLSSTLSFSFEKWYNKFKPGKRNTSLASVIASETGSNTGSASMMIPLLVFGVPITASEAIIYNIMIDNGAVFTGGQFIHDHYTNILLWFVASCLVGWILCSPLAKYFPVIIRFLLSKNATVILTSIICIIVLADGYREDRLTLSIVTFIISGIVGFLLKNKDLIPLVFVFILQNSFESVLYNLYQLYL